jgi:hypothetical protein
MAKDYLELGEVPYDEKCAQVGVYGYTKVATMEVAAFTNQLRRLLKANNKPEMDIRPKWEHGREASVSVVVYFDDENQDQIEVAYWLDENMPDKWDPEALEYLASKNYDDLYAYHASYFQGT